VDLFYCEDGDNGREMITLSAGGGIWCSVTENNVTTNGI